MTRVHVVQPALERIAQGAAVSLATGHHPLGHHSDKRGARERVQVCGTG